jgi:hypothetical protein
MSPEEPVTKESIDRLCALADLPLANERRTKLVPMFSGLVAAANELSRKMAQPPHRAVLPITRFTER